MIDKKILFLVITITVMILVGGIFLVSGGQSTANVKVSKKVSIQNIDPINFNWGNIPINGGNAKKTFRIKNSGIQDLEIFNIKTSCHCTVANLKTDTKTSQNFGMSGYSDWIGIVKPGKTAELNVSFDPAYHGPTGTGPVTRFISIETNAAGNEKIIFTLTGTVIK